MKKLTVYLSFVLAIFFANNLYSQNFTHNRGEIRETLTFLADDNMRGRGPGSLEDKESADYIASKLSEYGFKPIIGDSPLVPFNLLLYREIGFGSYLTIDGKRHVEWKDYKVHPQSPSANLSTILVFTSDSAGSLNNSAIVLKTTLDSIPFIAASLKSKGVSALIVNTGDKLTEERKGGTTALSIPVILITDETYSILKQSSRKTVDLKTVAYAVEGISYNVLMKYGRDDAPLDVMIGAHYDHLGMGGPSSGSMRPKEKAIHNGADDNASGVTAAVEAGRLLTKYADSLGINIIIAAFGAEERGLVGSQFIAHTLNKLKLLPNLMINLDMVGRLVESRLQIGGIGTFAEASDVVNKSNEKYNFTLSLVQDGYGPSDHASFYNEGVPVLYLTTGVHQQYHTPDDDIELINFEGLGIISEYIASVVSNISSKEVPKYIGTEAPPTMSQASLKVTLGVIPDFTYEKGDGFRVGAISSGKPAERGGMLTGDIIKKMNDRKISNIYEYMGMLGELSKGEILTLEIDRKGEIINLSIQL